VSAPPAAVKELWNALPCWEATAGGPGERAWLKVKNRGYWRYPYEIAALTMRQNPMTGQMVTPREPRTARCIR
jgi:hypothetical protein